MMSILPEDIINCNILTRLPLKSISRFRCVCKSWSNLFTDPNFVKKQLNHSLEHHSSDFLIDSDDTSICLVDYDSVSSTVSNKVTKIDYPDEFKKGEIVSVCNGLIIYVTYNRDIIIWNPFTKEYKKLQNPPESTCLNTKYFKIQYGFGYDARIEDYKFGMMVNSHSTRNFELNVYSFGTNSWKTIVNIPILHESLDHQLVLFNGIFHWVEFPTLHSGLPRVIGSFDLESETYRVIQLPQELLDKNDFTVLDLCLLEGCLYLVGSVDYVGIEVWMMKEYCVKVSWTKVFLIDYYKFQPDYYVKLISSLANGVILAEEEGLPCLYDPYKEEARKLEIDGIPAEFYPSGFVGSLVSPTFVTSLGTQ